MDLTPPNAADLMAMVDERCRAVQAQSSSAETETVTWRSQQLSLTVIAVDPKVLYLNPNTHRIRAQRSLDPERDMYLDTDPFGHEAQRYLNDLLIGNPSDPRKIDPAFETLLEDLKEHGQNKPGIITRSGILVNGNTRRVALMKLGVEHMRVAVLPEDASLADIEAVELSLQLQREHRREYTFMNQLLAIDERLESGWQAKKILAEFRIKQSTLDKSIWILQQVRQIIERSRVETDDGSTVGLRLVDFENDKGKLEELYAAYERMRHDSPDDAERMLEARITALVLEHSKTDLRLIGDKFFDEYMPDLLQSNSDGESPNGTPTPVDIPGLGIAAPGIADAAADARRLTDTVLRAKAIERNNQSIDSGSVVEAKETIKKVKGLLDSGLLREGKTARIQQRKLAPAERIGDASDNIADAKNAVHEARASNSFDPGEIDDSLVRLRDELVALAGLMLRDTEVESEGLQWLARIADVE